MSIGGGVVEDGASTYIGNTTRFNAREPTPMRESTTGGPNPVSDQITWRKKLANNRLKFDDRAKQIYLDELVKHGKKTLAANVANVTTETVQRHAKLDPDFAEAIQQCLDTLGQSRTQQVEQQALDGNDIVKTRVTADGEEEIHRETRFESGIRLAMLKRYDPAYRDSMDLNVSGNMGGVLIVPSVKTFEEWNALFHPDNPDESEHDEAA